MLFSTNALLPITLLLALIPNTSAARTNRNPRDLNRAKTNGERLARGLPLLAPTRRDPTRVRRSSPSGLPIDGATRPPTPASTSYDGYIRASYEANNTQFGYLGKSLSALGTFQITPDVSDALLVQVDVSSAASIMEEFTPLKIKNGTTSPGNLAGIATNATEFDVGSADFGVLGLSSEVTSTNNSYSTAVSVPTASQTTIWDYEVSNGDISASWWGADQFSRSLDFVLAAPENLVFTAKVNDGETRKTFSDAPIVKFTLERIGA